MQTELPLELAERDAAIQSLVEQTDSERAALTPVVLVREIEVVGRDGFERTKAGICTEQEVVADDILRSARVVGEVSIAGA